MIASLLLALLVTFSGAVATYLYDENASLGARLCTGLCLGLAAFGLIGFVIASFIGLSGAAILISAAITCSPIAILTDSRYRAPFQRDLNAASRKLSTPDAETIGYAVFYLLIAVVFWKIFDRAVIVDEHGLSTGLLNNFGDLPFHISVITGFAYGNNYPPEDPTYAGVRFTYPFLTDFISALFLRCGADVREWMFIENSLLAVAFVGVIHRWALAMLRDKLAAVITPLLVLLSGGLGWALLIVGAGNNEGGLWGALNALRPSFTVIPDSTWRWGNAISALLVPQRGFLMGLPLAVIVFTQWWLATDKTRPPQAPETTKKKRAKQKSPWQEPQPPSRIPLNTRRMIAAGV